MEHKMKYNLKGKSKTDRRIKNENRKRIIKNNTE